MISSNLPKAQGAFERPDPLAALYEGVSPGPVGDWVSGPWRDDARYRTPPGICANVTSR